MSEPRKNVRASGAARAASLEILSAMSSLNTYPDPVAPNTDTSDVFISVSDRNVYHAMEHLASAHQLANLTEVYVDDLKNQVYRLVCQLRRAGVKPTPTWLDEED